MDENLVIKAIDSIGEKGGVGLLLRIISPMINEQVPGRLISIAVDSMLSAGKEDDLLPHHYVCTITSMCNIVPKAIDLFAGFSGGEEGATALAANQGSFEVITSILISKNVDCACSAASIFSDCVISGDEFVLKRMQETGVVLSLVTALSDSNKSMREEFVQDALYVIGSLLSVLGALQLKLGHKCIERIENAAILHQENEYISQVAGDILLDLRENLNDEKEITIQLQHLADAHIEAQTSSQKQTAIYDNSTTTKEQTSTDQIEKSHGVEAQLDILMEMTGDFDRELSFIDATATLPLIDILVSYSTNIKIVTMTLTILKKLKPLAWVVDMIIIESKLTHIVDIIQQFIMERDLVDTLLQILAISTRDTSQHFEHLMNLDTLLIINKALLAFVEVETIVMSGSEIFANLFE
eukprot:519112-Ditylum_brightwellii.AAC.1